MSLDEVRDKLIHSGLKVTPQRVAILEAVVNLNNHPTVEQIIDYIRISQPNISTATVYKVLDALVENALIKRVNTERDITRYDAILEPHHHIYYPDSNTIEDYIDHELTDLLKTHFGKKEIPGVIIEDIKLQIVGRCKKTAAEK
ncbi:MAG: Fur family transcriptional regulator [Prolixibacteraceae bacterium]